MPVRRPHVAGSFYPADPHELKQYGELRFSQPQEPRSVRSVILPHAGYVYSGDTACRVLNQVDIPDQVLLIGPDHFARGSEFSVYDEGSWQTPLGSVEIDAKLAKFLFEDSPLLAFNEEAHSQEHSLEVIVPLLQLKKSSFQIVPILIGTLNLKTIREAALDLGMKMSALKEKPLVVISNDMSHYDSDAATRKKDRYALDAIQNLDADALVKAVKEHGISMCGFAPVYLLLNLVGALGIQKATLIDYRTSADASGDTERVVGYAGFIFE